jgi:hypothetical protein
VVRIKWGRRGFCRKAAYVDLVGAGRGWTLPESVPCCACLGDGRDPLQPDNPCTECAGQGEVPAPTPEELQAMLAQRREEPLLTEAEINQLADLVEIDMRPDATPF